MGMFLSKYSMLHSIGYGGNRNVKAETIKILDKYKLFGIIIHDPTYHKDFDLYLESQFERLDYITGRDFLFFGLTNPSQKWVQKNHRDYFGIWEDFLLLSTENRYQTQNESMSAYTLATSLGIAYDDLPVILLTNDFSSNHYQIVKTCPKHLTAQMTEIGYWATQQETKYYDLLDDAGFNELIKNIDLCGGATAVSADTDIAKTLSDFLAFVLYDKRNTNDTRLSREHVSRYIADFSNKIKMSRSPAKIEQLNLALLGYLAQLRGLTSENQVRLRNKIGIGLERESGIILDTFDKIAPVYESRLSHLHHESRMHSERYNQFIDRFDIELDYTPLVMSLCKVFEIEVNLSVVQWIRSQLNIEMPEYFKKYKPDRISYTITPSQIPDARPIDFNKSRQGKWLAPGIGESEMATIRLATQGISPFDTDTFDLLMSNWKILREYRNKAAHVEQIDVIAFENTKSSFNFLIDHGILKNLLFLKHQMKQ